MTTSKVPGNWHKFLASIENLKKLFSFLSKKVTEQPIDENKTVYITNNDLVHRVGDGNSSSMPPCNHEEADTRVLVHLFHALETSFTWKKREYRH